MKWRDLIIALAANDFLLAAIVFAGLNVSTPKVSVAVPPIAHESVALAAAPVPAPQAAPPRLEQPSGDPAYGACPQPTDDQAWERIRQEPWLPFLGQQVGVSPPGIAKLKLCFDYSYGKRYEGQMTTARWRATWEHRANLFALSLGLDPIYVADEPGADLFPRVKRTLEVYRIADTLGIQY